MYNPINSAIVAAEIVSAVVMMIVAYAVLIDKTKTLSQKFFLGCVLSVFVILISDALSYVFDGYVENTAALYAINFTTIIIGDILMVFFGLYIMAMINEKKKVNNILIYIVLAIAIIDFLFEIYSCSVHLAFDVVDGFFQAGPLYDIPFIVQLAVMALCMVFLIINIKVLGKKTLFFFVLYYFFPTIAVFIILYDPNLSFICTSIAISFLVIYIGIEKESKDILMAKLLRTDTLTGLSNRNLYEERVLFYKNSEVVSNLGVIFCDVNGLKYVNDNFGHAKGDQLIIKFGNILKNHFTLYEVFRISGDEFIVLVNGQSDKMFANLYKELREDIARENSIASCGQSFGMDKDIYSLIASAEKNMYDDKYAYYEKHGNNRRRNRSDDNK